MRHTKLAVITDDAAISRSGASRTLRETGPTARGAGCKEWTARDRHKAARLLVEIRTYLAAQGIQNVHDTRIEASLRQLWLRLIASNAVESLSIDEAGRQWQCLEGSRNTSVCGTAASSTANGERKTPLRRAVPPTLWDCGPDLRGSAANCGSE